MQASAAAGKEEGGGEKAKKIRQEKSGFQRDPCAGQAAWNMAQAVVDALRMQLNGEEGRRAKKVPRERGT